jgi:hypothetical protein
MSVVVELITPDSSVSDPDGSQGTPLGGRMLRHGLDAVGTKDGFRPATPRYEGVLLLAYVGPAVPDRYRRAVR